MLGTVGPVNVKTPSIKLLTFSYDCFLKHVAFSFPINSDLFQEPRKQSKSKAAPVNNNNNRIPGIFHFSAHNLQQKQYYNKT